MDRNPLIPDREVEFLLYEQLGAQALCRLRAFREHSRETFDPYLEGARRLARELLFPAYKPMDEAAPQLRDGRVLIHPRMRELYPQLVSMGVINATRPDAVGGMNLPLTVQSMATAYLMAANLSAFGFLGLT